MFKFIKEFFKESIYGIIIGFCVGLVFVYVMQTNYGAIETKKRMIPEIKVTIHEDGKADTTSYIYNFNKYQ